MKERYQNMMEQVKLSEAGRNAIAQRLTERTTRARKNPLQWGLAAASVCLVLMGGVFAAGQFAKVLVSEPQSGVDHSEYQVSVDLQEEEEKAFSTVLTNDFAHDTLQRAFADRTALEAYLGFGLIHSELLETAGINEHLERDFAYNWNLRPELAVAPDARYVLTATTYDGEEMRGVPEVLKISTHRVVENYTVYLDARIITGSMDGQIDLLGEEFAPEPLIDHQLLVDENGYLILDENGEAIMQTTLYESAEKIFHSESYVMANGIEATIVTVETPDPSLQRAEEAGLPTEGSGVCDYIGYFVYDGILYSIRPYGIYDNTIPDNYVNGRELMILYHILDSFA